MNWSAFRIGRTLLGVFALAFLLSPSTPADDSAALYKTKCTACHGVDGKGDTVVGKKTGARDFASAEVQKETDQELIDITAKGKNKMPAYASSLSDAQIKGLVAYIHALEKK